MTNRSISTFSFEIVYNQVPCLTLDIAHLHVSIDLSAKETLIADRIKKIHEEVRQNLEASTTSYKLGQPLLKSGTL